MDTGVPGGHGRRFRQAWEWIITRFHVTPLTDPISSTWFINKFLNRSQIDYCFLSSKACFLSTFSL
jgi:hypothetical protein